MQIFLWGIKIINVEYDKPNVTLTYRNVAGEKNKVLQYVRI